MKQSTKKSIETLFLIALLTVNSFIVPAQSIPPKETQVKAVFLYNFAQFAQWPEEKFADATAPIIIGILGPDPFGPFLDEIVKGEKINGHPVEVRRFTDPEAAEVSHILFITKGSTDDLSTLMKDLEGKNVVTVGDFDGFTRQGGMIEFFIEKNKMRFEVNMTSYKDNHVVLSSRLLRLAKICCE